MSAIDALIFRLEARARMNEATAEMHPDVFVRELSLARVDAYRTALADARELLLVAPSRDRDDVIDVGSVRG